MAWLSLTTSNSASSLTQLSFGMLYHLILSLLLLWISLNHRSKPTTSKQFSIYITIYLWKKESHQQTVMESTCYVSGCSAWNLFYFAFLFFLVCGDQMVEQYSRFDLTRDLYAILCVCSLFIWRFLLKIPNN
jgi:hypothetical protein